jgi:tetratricopeptide (TPR) repeat protein
VPEDSTPCRKLADTVALFKKKEVTTEEADAKGAQAAEAIDQAFSPKKAKAFFDRAQTVHDSTNYEYAMQNWLTGLRWDPTNMEAFRGFLRSADSFLIENPKGKVGKEVRSAIDAKGAVSKYIDALLDFGVKKTDAGAAVKASVAASDVGAMQVAQFVGKYAMNLVAADPKRQKKDTYVKLLGVLEKAEDYQTAAIAGEEAMKLDPSDGELQARVRNMMARATMSKGGFEDDTEGGFRKNIRNSDKQAQLAQEDSMSKTDATKDSILERTKAEHEERNDMPTLEAYTRALLSRGKPVDELRAMGLLSGAYKETGQFRFRQRSGEIQLKVMRRGVKQLKRAAQANPDDAESVEKYENAAAQLHTKELEELKLQAENYPTDLPLKFKLGKVHFAREEYDEAIAQFQEAQQDSKSRDEVLLYMGQSFQRLGGWVDEAIQTFRRGLESVSHESELGMELRYGLMRALEERATESKDLVAAQEADKLAAGIAIKSFSYKDIKDRRAVIKSLIKDLSA